MPFSMRFEPETGLVIATCSGAMGLNDAREGAAAVWEKPEWSGNARFILERQPAIPPSRVAFVTARDVDFGLVRMFLGIEVGQTDRCQSNVRTLPRNAGRESISGGL